MTKKGRQEWFRYRRLEGKSYRRPRGNQSKARRHLKGKRALPKAGFGTPKATRHLHPCGLREMIVRNVDELTGSKNVAVRIAGKVGRRKRLKIVEKAKSLSLKILNLPKVRKAKTKEKKPEAKPKPTPKEKHKPEHKPKPKEKKVK